MDESWLSFYIPYNMLAYILMKRIIQVGIVPRLRTTEV
jgi:hypothetical protein